MHLAAQSKRSGERVGNPREDTWERGGHCCGKAAGLAVRTALPRSHACTTFPMSGKLITRRDAKPELSKHIAKWRQEFLAAVTSKARHPTVLHLSAKHCTWLQILHVLQAPSASAPKQLAHVRLLLHTTPWQDEIGGWQRHRLLQGRVRVGWNYSVACHN
jgi:hypothetical protein